MVLKNNKEARYRIRNEELRRESRKSRESARAKEKKKEEQEVTN